MPDPTHAPTAVTTDGLRSIVVLAEPFDTAMGEE